MDLDELIEAENARTGALLLNALSWSVEEFLELPEAACRMELLDGGLLMLAAPGSDHQDAVLNLALLLRVAKPGGWKAIAAGNLELGSATLLRPDVMLVTRTDPRVTFASAEAVMIAEVESPGSLHVDRILKPALYAEAGIDWYLRVELQRSGSPAPTVIAYRLEDGAYVEHSRATAGQTLHLTEPVEASFDPAVLLDEDLSRLEPLLKAWRQTSG